MKNRRFLFFLVLLGCFGCSGTGDPEKNDMPHGKEILFTAEPLTRTVSTDFSVGDKLGILAYQTDASGLWNPVCKPDFMYNVPLEKTTAGFEYSPVMFYPNDGNKVKFFAYYPYSTTSGEKGITLSEASASGYPYLDFQYSADGNPDLLIAVTEPQNEGNVYLKCDHVLAKVNFSVRTNFDYECDPPVVTSLELKDLKSSGRFLFKNYITKPADSSTWWDTTGGIGTSKVLTFTTGITLNNVNYTTLLSEPLLLIPQSTKVTLVVNYLKKGVAGQATTDVVWTTNKAVDYQIELNLGTCIEGG